MLSPGGQSYGVADPKYVRTESVTGRRIFEFKSYRDCQLFQFTVPIDTKVSIYLTISCWELKHKYELG